MEELYSSKTLLKKVPTSGSTPDPLTKLVTVGTEIAAPHKQQVTIAAEQLRFR